MNSDNLVGSTFKLEVDLTNRYDYSKLVAEELEEYSNIEVTEELNEGGIHAAKAWGFWFQYLSQQVWKTSLGEEIVHFCSRISEPRILSLGCGYGGHELKIARSLKSPYEIIAVDLNPDIFTRARAEAAAQDLNIRFLPVDINYMELKADSFDLVIAIASLHHILNLEHVFHQIYESLKPGGRLIVQDVIGQTQVLFWKNNIEFAIDLLRKMPAKYSADISIPLYSEPSTQVGMEGIRQEEIEPLLRRHFIPIKMFKYGSFMRMICTHPELGKRLNPDIEADRQYLLSIFELDVRQVEEGKLRPTEMLAVYEKRAPEKVDAMNEHVGAINEHIESVNTEEHATMDKLSFDQWLRREIGREDFWFHQMEIAPGVITPGWDMPAEGKLQHFGLPERMDDLRVLDIGCAEGFFSFEAERRGAKEIVAIDPWPGSIRRFNICKAALNSHATAFLTNIYDLNPQRFGTFDLVMCFGVLYHLRHPLLALERVFSVCSGTLLLQSTGYEGSDTDEPVARFFPNGVESGPPNKRVHDRTVFWVPNTACVRAMLEHIGFVNVEFLSSDICGPVFRAQVPLKSEGRQPDFVEVPWS
jgi:tRNA (mo5U34)-methyltransferase